MKTRIALLVGNDLEGAGKFAVKEHLASCESCRGYLRDMQSSLQVLREPVAATDDAEFKTLWPQISHRLPKRARQPRQSRFNHWAAAGSVIAACSVLMAFAFTYHAPYAPSSSPTWSVQSNMFSVPTGSSGEFNPGNTMPVGHSFGPADEEPTFEELQANPRQRNYDAPRYPEFGR